MYVAISPSRPVAPAAMAGDAGLPRSVGAVRLAFLGVSERTALADLHQQGCMKARLPRALKDEPLTAVLINTAGGLTGGDRVGAEVGWPAGAVACVTTQAAERIYRSTGAVARVRNRLSVGAGARAEWLPQETIVFEAGRLDRQTEVDMDEGANLLAAESVVLGRRAMGETVATGAILDGWQVRLGGRLVYADRLRLGEDIAADTAYPGCLAGMRAWSQLIVAAPDPDGLRDLLRERLADFDGIAGATRRGPLVLTRLMAADGDRLRRGLARLLPELRHRLFGHAPRLPRVFQC